MFYYKEGIKLIAEYINFHVGTIMFKLIKNVSLAYNPLYDICRVYNAQCKQNAIQKTKIAIIGAEFGGLAMAIRLLQNKQTDFLILEKSNDGVELGAKTLSRSCM
ncbi:hypothetical protein IDM33_00675 [Acinetobacter seifertii]|nr:hypothetical protein [Acinetobacter seifertii]